MNWEWLDYIYVRGAIFSIIALIGFYAAFRLVRFSLDLLEDKIHAWKGTKFSDIKFQKVVLLSQNQIVETLEHLIDFTRWCTYIFLLLLWMTVTLNFFPDTESIAVNVWASVIDPLKIVFMDIVGYIPKLILITIIIFVVRFLLKGVRFFFNEVERGSIHLRKFHKDWATPTYQIVRFVILIFAFIMILPNLPASNSESFKGVSLFIGILVSLGSTTAIGNMVAGIVITYMRPFTVNDFVTIDNVTGKVLEKSLLMTRLLTPRNEEITIPNLKILSHTIVNYTTKAKEEGVIFYTNVGVSYDQPWQKVQALLTEAANRCKLIEKTPAPFVLQSKLADHYALYELNAYTKQPDLMIHVYSELKQNIFQVLAENKVELMLPLQYSLHQSEIKPHSEPSRVF